MVVFGGALCVNVGGGRSLLAERENKLHHSFTYFSQESKHPTKMLVKHLFVWPISPIKKKRKIQFQSRFIKYNILNALIYTPNLTQKKGFFQSIIVKLN